MSKFTKLIFQPKKFLNDSQWFKKNNLNLKKPYKNIFIISHLGQLNQVESLIEYEQIKNCLLVILYTNKNTKVPKSIQNQYDKNIFDNSILFLLPNSPNNYKIKSLIFMKRNYEELISIVNPDNLYLLSFENHYSLLANVAKKSNVNLHLIDEGTATYKSPDLSEYYQEQTILKKIIAKSLNVDQAFYWTTIFDTVYAAFPELLKSTFQAKSYNRFFAHAGQFNLDTQTSKLLNTYYITSNDFIYVNQRYPIQDNDFVDAILEILHKISNHYQSKVFIKMHPKDSDTLKNNFIAKLHNYQNIIFIQENEFLIEPAIQAINPKGVIGLTSTSLVYTPLISPKTKVYSIKPWFIDLIPKENNQTGINIINDHYTILQQFKHVNVLNKDMQFNKKLDNNTKKSLNTSRNNYIENAKSAYAENKYQQSLVNYIWAYPDGAASMPMDDFLLYLKAFKQKNSLVASRSLIQTWINAEICSAKDKSQDYTDFISIILTLIEENNEYSGHKLTINTYNDLIALLTNNVDIDIYPIVFIDAINMLKSKYPQDVLSLFQIESQINILQNNYTLSVKNLNILLGHPNYFSQHEYLYIDLLKSYIGINNEESVTQLAETIANTVKDDKIQLIATALVDLYKKDYEKVIHNLAPTIETFEIDLRKRLKPELLIAKAYRLLNKYKESKSFLFLFERHTKKNLLCSREKAHLAYDSKNYTKALSQFQIAYPDGAASMPMDDFLLYLDLLDKEQNYEDIYHLTKDDLTHTQITYYYLVSLYKLKYYTKYIQENKNFNLDTLTLEKKESILWITVIINRKLGNIEEAYLILLSNDTLPKNNINNLLYTADIFELSHDYKKANDVWKLIIKNFHRELPNYAWDRYYKTLDLTLSC